MKLPVLPKREPRPFAVTVRLSKTGAETLRMLARTHNMSQADVVERLLSQAAQLNRAAKKQKE